MSEPESAIALSPAQKAARTKRLRKQAAEAATQAATQADNQAVEAPPKAATEAPPPSDPPAAPLPAATQALRPAPVRVPRPAAPPPARQAPPQAAPPPVLRPDRLAFVADAGDLATMLRAALLFAGREIKHPERRIVRFESDGKTLHVISTNGHCLYNGEMPARQSELTAGALEMHVESAIEVHNAIRKWKKDAAVLVNAEQAKLTRVSNPKDSLPLHRGDAQFPDWRVAMRLLEEGDFEAHRFGIQGKYLVQACTALSATPTLVWTMLSSESNPTSLRGETIEGYPASVMIAPCRV